MKQKILFFLILGLGLILPLSRAKAFDPIIGSAVAAALAVVGGWILHLISFATAGLVGSASSVLHWVLYDLPFSYTKLVDSFGDPTIVGIGWPIVRDLTNMLFVIILVFIGLAIALRLKDYEAKKTLVPLIIIALLVNFTPVIIGVIVDASNIVMNFFLQDLSPGAYWERHLSLQKSIMPTGWEFLNPFKHMENTLAALMLVIMDLIVFAILFMYTLLFLVRYVAIWVLVILSPLAFACYILPATRKFFSQWWDQLLQWCIIGIIGAFFLYLGTHLFKIVEGMQFSAEGQGMIVELAIKLISLVTLIIFYIIGLMMAFSTSAMGAKQITAGFKRGYKAAGKTTAFKAWGGYTATHKATEGAVKPLVQRAKLTYKMGGRLGLTKRESFAAAAKGAVSDIKRGLRPKSLAKTTWKATKAATKGVKTAIKDIGVTGLKAGFGIKAKKKGKKSSRKGFQICPTCGEEIDVKAKTCPKCGLPFE